MFKAKASQPTRVLKLGSLCLAPFNPSAGPSRFGKADKPWHEESMFDKNDAKIEQERAEAEEKRQRTGFESPHGDEWRWLCSRWPLRLLPVLFGWLVGRFFASFCMRATFCPQAGRDEQGSRERELQPNDQTSQGDVLARAKLLFKHVLVSKLATDRLLEPTISLSWLSLLGLPAWWLFHNALGARVLWVDHLFLGLFQRQATPGFFRGFSPGHIPHLSG